MAKRMLIDAAHPEEIRVALLKGNRLEDFDFETATKKQLKGNIYLAKVTRVEPSLQAAFVDYGGNRHGFLAFNEIHPDYYRIPVADREALLAQERALAEPASNGDPGDRGEGEDVETVGGDDIEEVGPRRFRPPRPYKIQEVTKRRQILLVQVVKEERGNKGAALTTYLSLAGRYCVLMPNTPRGGGISRKITNLKDRRRLKNILEEFEVPDGMSVIVRTAGMERSKAEIKRDLEYLMRLWDEIRELTLKSTAPALIYEEANLIKRAIRDLYDRDIDEIHVEGDDGYRAAKDFMRMLTPSHAKRVHQYKDALIPLFHRYQVENQIDGIQSPTVQLKSGGYIVITPTEALVSIDVNSGRATKERNIEETALRTNSEAAEEIARQLRLRDLAGLIVIDFIDMEEPRNNAAVERKLKEAMRFDRARIQIGRISPFGLLELSRQRLRPSLIEATMQHCSHCAGSGWVRSIESTALHVLRGLEEEGIRQRSAELKLTVPRAVALYLLNQKRAAVGQVEQRYHFSVFIDTDDTLVPPAFRLERTKIAEFGAQPVSVAAELPAAVSTPAEVGTEREGEGVDGAAFDERLPPEHQAREHRLAEYSAEGERGGPEGRRRRRRRRRRRHGGEEAQGRELVGQQDARRPSDETPAPPGMAHGARVDSGTETAYGAEGHGGGAAQTEGFTADVAKEQRSTGEVVEGPNFPEGPDSESEQRRRRSRGRRGGRRRRRGERQGDELAGAEPSVPSASPLDLGANASGEFVPAATPEEGREAGRDAAIAVAEAERAPRRSARRPRRGGVAADIAVTVTEATKVSSAPTGGEHFSFSPPTEPHSQQPIAHGSRTERSEDADKRESTEPQAPAIPVITVGTDTGEQPKRRGWWRRLTD